MNRRGFTLTEVLVALMIFSIVSTAMVGTLLLGTRLFREGEMGRAANDEAMSVLAVLDRDLEAAVPYAQYGDFYAVIPDTEHPDCVVGWTITNPDPETAHNEPTRFVLWGRDRNGVLRRTLLDSIAVLDGGGNATAADDNLRNNDPRDRLANGTVITDRCRFFGAWLGATGAASAFPEEVRVIPEENTWWQRMWKADGSGPATATPPIRDTPALDGIYATDRVPSGQLGLYPGALRVMLLLEGRGGTAKDGILLEDNTDSLRIAGIQGLSTAPGSVILVEYPGSGGTYDPVEIVGYRSYAGGYLEVNQNATDGPLGSGGKGRGVFRSITPGTHPRGRRVTACRTFSLVRALPR